MNETPLTIAEQLAANPTFITQVESGTTTAELHRCFDDFSYETVRRAKHIAITGVDPTYGDKPVDETASLTGSMASKPIVEKQEVFSNDQNTWDINLPDTDISTYEEFVKRHKIDTRVWRCLRFEINEKKWEQGAKNKECELIKQDLKSFGIKASFTKNKEAFRAKEVFEELLEDCRKYAPKARKPFAIHETRKSDNLHEIALFDPHLGKLCWGAETGADYDSDITAHEIVAASAMLRHYAEPFSPGRILLPLGNDFFNIDGQGNMTTAGTPQDVDSRWKKMFRLGRELMVNVIDELSESAPVDVIIVPGNHDTEAAWHMGEALSCWYHNSTRVDISNTPKQRKYYPWGKCLIGFTHGDKEPLKNLPLIMATEEPLLWAQSTFREFHLGHFHSKRDMMSQPVGEFNGAKVCMLPSLSASDAWHYSKGYNSQRAAESFVWHKENGRVANFSYSPAAAQE